MRSGLSVVVLCGTSALALAGERSQEPARDFPRSYFMRALVSKDPAERRQAFARAKREYADEPRMAEVLGELLGKIHRDRRLTETSTQLVQLLRNYPVATTAPILQELLESNNVRVTIAALDVLAARPNPALLPAIAALARRPAFHLSFGLRFTALTAVTKIPGRDSAAFLIDRLPQLTGRCEELVLRRLARAAGQNYGRDYSAWRKWLKEGGSLAAATVASTGLEEDGDRRSLPTFFGVPITAKRIAFVVDKSGSMSGRLNVVVKRDGNTQLGDLVETRIFRAQRELTNAVTQLPPDVYFNIVVFSDGAATWQPGLVPATAVNKVKALKFISSISAGGDTAWFDALAQAMALDGNLEVIYFLTDGEPTVGQIVSQPEIVRAISSENYFRRIIIHAVGMGVSTTAEGFLATLADRNGGTYRSIGRGQAQVIKELQAQPTTRKFAPRRVARKPMPPISGVPAVPAADADQWVKDDELVLGVSLGGQARAYPINMLTGTAREIVNDDLGSRPIAVTWCHSSHNAIVYARRTRDQTLTFAVSGLVWNDNLLLIDLQTRSLWSQLYGRAMHGPMQGVALERLPLILTDWSTWRRLHPETTVLTLSRSTRRYNRNFYRRLNQFVIGVSHGDAARAWTLSSLAETPVANDAFEQNPLLVTFDARSKTAVVFDRRVDSRTLTFVQKDGALLDEQTRSRWDPQAGQARSGPLCGKVLHPVPSTVSFRAAWEVFYPWGSVYENSP